MTLLFVCRLIRNAGRQELQAALGVIKDERSVACAMAGKRIGNNACGRQNVRAEPIDKTIEFLVQWVVDRIKDPNWDADLRTIGEILERVTALEGVH